MIVALPKALTLRVFPQGNPLKRIGSRPAVNFGSLKGGFFYACNRASKSAFTWGDLFSD
jgi:hypothetical protein